jgi:hypothetical protein
VFWKNAFSIRKTNQTIYNYIPRIACTDRHVTGGKIQAVKLMTNYGIMMFRKAALIKTLITTDVEGCAKP